MSCNVILARIEVTVLLHGRAPTAVQCEQARIVHGILLM
jgi:hypothetical protein